MRISTKRSDLPEGKYLGSKVKSLGLIVPMLFLLMNFQTVWSQQFTTLDLVQSTDQVTWNATAGDMTNGFEYCLDPAVTYYYMTTAATTATDIPVAAGFYGFTVDQTLLPSGWLTYWDGRGVDGVNDAGGWELLMWSIINGSSPIFFIESDGLGGFGLLDGLQYTLSAGAVQDPFRINGDYLPGDYTFNGNLGGSSLSFNAIVNQIPATPEFTTLELEESTDGVTWVATAGDMTNGFEYCLTSGSGYALNIASTSVTNVPLLEGMYGFDVTAYPADWFTYWATRGVDANITGDWTDHMWLIINGNSPIFYLKVDALGDMMLVDGLQYDFASNETYLGINGDYLVGDYTYSGTVDAGCGVTNTVSFDATVSQQPVVSLVDLISPVSCFGALDAEVTITATGDPLSYTFNGVNNLTGEFTGLGMGVDYPYTVSGGPSCVDVTGVFTVNDADELTASASVTTAILCYGGAGEVTIAATGGTGALAYTFDGTTNATGVFTGVLAGTAYDWSVTDANNCGPVTGTLDVVEPDELTASATVTDAILCNGGTAEVTITALDGTGAYTYTFNGVTNATGVFNIVAGTAYVWSVTDVNNCGPVTGTLDVLEPVELTASASVTSAILCNGGTGEVTIAANGGTGTYTYTFNAMTNSTGIFTGVLAGTGYAWSVTDANSCGPVTGTLDVNQPDALATNPVVSNYSGFGVTCNGIADGTITLNPSGGTLPYSYMWNDGEVTMDRAMIAGGTYDVNITDFNGCQFLTTVFVTEPADLTLNLAPSNYNGYEVSIFGNNDGSIDATVGGGTGVGTYSFAWSNGELTEDISGLTIGGYTVVVTDLNGCQINDGEILAQPDLLEANLVGYVDVACYGESTGSIDMDVIGGVPPYFYVWTETSSGPLAQFTADPSSLLPGEYTLQVTDINNATVTSVAVQISQPLMPMSAQLYASDVVCHGDGDGNILAEAFGGQGPYTFVWYRQSNLNDSLFVDPGVYTSLFDGLEPDAYCVTIEDANGCNITVCEIIETPPVLDAWTVSVSNFNGFNVSCFGASDAEIDIEVSGGIPPYDYAWGNNYANDQDGTGLWAGPWGVWVEDANGCDYVLQWILTEPNEIIANAWVVNDISCNGVSDGNAEALATGGEGALTIEWFDATPASLGTGTTLSMVPAGIYSIEVTDALTGCGANDQGIAMGMPSWNPTITADSHTIAIPTANISLNGGPAQDGDYIGVFYVDGAGLGCAGFSIIDGATTVVTAWGDDGSLAPAKNGMGFGEGFTWKVFRPFAGEFAIEPPSYNLAWSPGNFAPFGASQVSLFESNDVVPQSVVSIEITEPTTLEFPVAGVMTHISCFGFNDGTIDITVDGGTLPYTYTWATTTGSGIVVASEDQINLTAGDYTVTVVDAHGCSIDAAFTITQPNQLVATHDLTTNVLCYGSNEGGITITVNEGTAPYSYAWTTADGSIPSGTDGDEDIFGLTAGTYDVVVTDDEGCQVDILGLVVTEPDQLYLQGLITSTNVLCIGSNEGSITINNAIGGTPAYTYTWTTADGTIPVGMENNQNLTGLVAGTYTVDVTDIYNCTTLSTESYTITEPTQLVYVSHTVSMSTAGNFNVDCNGDDDAWINIVFDGGTPPYTYVWDSGQNGVGVNEITNLSAANADYSVVVTDANGCTASYGPINLTQPEVISVSTPVVSLYNGYSVECFGDATGTIDIDMLGGVTPYTYVWTTTDGDIPVGTEGDEDLSGLVIGTYEVLITDANGCFTNTSATITQPTELVWDSANPNSQLSYVGGHGVSCGGYDDGGITIYPIGGLPTYTFAWTASNGGTIPAGMEDDQNLTGITAGDYTVVVTDINGCSITDSFTLTETETLVITAGNLANVVCNGGDEGSVTASVVSGGIGGFTYEWSTIGGSIPAGQEVLQTMTGLTAGVYSVTVTDGNGCLSFAGVDNTIPWVFQNTGINHTILIPDASGLTYGGGPLLPGDYIGVFYEEAGVLVNAGVGEYTGDGTTVVAWGDDPYTTPKDGFEVGDAFHWKIWRPFVAELPATPAYIDASTNPDFSDEGLFAIFGMSGLTDLDNNDNLAVIDVTFTEVTEPDVLTASIVEGDPIACIGGVTNITSIVAGGTMAYTYAWSNGETTSDLTGVPIGTYSLVVTDDHGCSATTSAITIAEPTQLVVSTFSTSDAICFGTATATITLDISGGTAPYTEDWGGENPTTLLAGTYGVTVTDANGCWVTHSETVGEATELVITSVDGVDPQCNGGVAPGALGSAEVFATGGTGAYTYIWSTGATTPVITDLYASVTSYNVTVTDFNGCFTTGSVVINEPTQTVINSGVVFEHPGLIDGTTTAPNVSCNGASDGAIAITVIEGTPGYTFAWSTVDGTIPVGNETNQDQIDLPIGTYTVTAYDSYGCASAPESYTLVGPAPMAVSLVSVSQYDVGGVLYNTTCNGVDGAIDIDVTGGSLPYTFAWSYGQTTEDLLNVPAGTYGVAVEDANGCAVTLAPDVVLNTPGPQNVTIVSAETYPILGGTADIRCNGGNGSIQVNWEQGVGPFDFYWSEWTITETLDFTPANPLNQTFTEVGSFPAGIYWVAVYDDNGCAQLSNILEITEPDPIVPAPGLVNPLCNGDANGSIDLSQTTGGSGSYLIQWDGAANWTPNPTLTGLADGDDPYVVIWDSNNCSEGFQYFVEEPTAVLINSVATTDALCNGTATGTITVDATGGTPGYTYSIDGSTYYNELVDIAAGTYTVYVKDANGCVESTTATIGEPALLQASISAITNVSCFGASDGALTTTTLGGTSPYYYDWVPVVTGAATDGFQYTNVPSGTYTVVVSDANGCEVTLSDFVDQPAEIVLTANLTATTCVGYDDGAIDLVIDGGTAGYGVNWGFATTEDLDNLFAGTYPVIVTDANGCVASETYTVEDAPAIIISADITDALCYGDANGEIDLTVTGGTGVGTYSYLWSPNSEVDADLTGLAMGTYSVVVTDGNTCSESASFDVEQPDVLAISIAAVDVTCFGGNDGSITVTTTGGTSPMDYYYDAVISASNVHPNLISDNYLIEVIDANGCAINTTQYISEPALIVLDLAVSNVSCNGLSDASIDLTVAGGTAGSTFTYAWDNNEVTEDLTGLAIGTYNVVVTESTGCTMAGSVTITEPAPLTVTLTTANVVCFGDANGSVTAVPVGGSLNYFYDWSPNGETTNVISGLMAGTYSVVVSDDNGCEISASAEVQEAAPLGLALTASDVDCNLSADGEIALDITGGATPFTFFWQDDAHTMTSADEDLTGLIAGTYNVTVTDANGCVGNASADILITYSFVIENEIITDVSCNNNNDALGVPGSVSQNGSVSVEMTEGHFNFQWTNSNGNPILYTDNDSISTLSNVPAGIYNLEITHQFYPCTSYATYEVVEPDELDIAATISNASCYKFSNGNVMVDVTGGTLPYNYQWTNGANVVWTQEDLVISIPNDEGFKAGTYKLVVTDGQGCNNQVISTITQPSLLTSSINVSDATCLDADNGSLFADINGGTMPYNYLWSTGDVTNSISGLEGSLTGMNYTLAVIDANGCTVDDDADVFEPTGLVVSPAQIDDVTCFGLADGFATVIVSGGTPITTGGSFYTFAWDNGSLNESVENVVAGTYTVTAYDANSCPAITTVDILEPTQLSIGFTVTTISPTLTIAEASVSGGTPGYTYLWNTLETTPSIAVNAATTYYITAYDANMCDVQGYVDVPGAPTATTDNAVAENNDISDIEVSIYPNPSADGRFVIDFGQYSSENVQLQVVDGFGKVIQNNIIPGSISNQVELRLQVAKGVYYLKISTEENGSVTKTLVITE